MQCTRPAMGVLLAIALLLSALSIGAAESVLSVNDETIDSSALYAYMVKRHGFRSLLNLLSEAVIEQEAAKKGITVTDAEIDALIQERRDELNKTAVETGVNFDSMLAGRGQTLGMFREGERSLMLIKKMVADDVDITDAKVREHYEKNQQNFRLKEAMKVSYIRLHDPDPEKLTALLEEVRTLRQQVIAGDLNFEQAAREYSACPYTKADGGKLDRWLMRGRTPFLEAAFKLLQDGDISDPVLYPGLGFYLIRRDDYVRDYVLDFDEVSVELENVLRTEQVQQLVAAEQRKLLEAADVKWLIDWPEGSFKPEDLSSGPPTPDGG